MKKTQNLKQKKKLQKTSFDLTKFDFLYDHILVKAIKSEGISGLVKPESYDDKPEFGEIISRGLSTSNELDIGDIIFFSKYSSEQTRSLGEDYYIIRSDDVRAVLK